MNATATYAYLVRARNMVADIVRPLPEAVYRAPHDISLGSLARLLTHTYVAERYYVARIEAQPLPPYDSWPIRDEDPPAWPVLESAWATQAEETRAAIARHRDWTAPITYEVTDDSDQRMQVRTSAEELVTQLVLHEVHHRAQVLHILRRIGHPAPDMDFNSFFPRTPLD